MVYMSSSAFVPTVRTPTTPLPRIANLPRPWPLEPLVTAAINHHTPWNAGHGSKRMPTYKPTAIHNALGLSGATLRRAQERGLTDLQAERFAWMLDLEPARVWPGWFDYPLTPEDRAGIELEMA